MEPGNQAVSRTVFKSGPAARHRAVARQAAIGNLKAVLTAPPDRAPVCLSLVTCRCARRSEAAAGQGPWPTPVQANDTIPRMIPPPASPVVAVAEHGALMPGCAATMQYAQGGPAQPSAQCIQSGALGPTKTCAAAPPPPHKQNQRRTLAPPFTPNARVACAALLHSATAAVPSMQALW